MMRILSLWVTFFVNSLVLAQGTDLSLPKQKKPYSMGLRVDCSHSFNSDKGTKQGCINISGLRLLIKEKIDDKLFAQIKIDPFGSPDASLESLPFGLLRRPSHDSRLYFFDSYTFQWSPRPNLFVNLQSFDGVKTIPSMSHLATAGTFSGGGWRQTALVFAFQMQALNGMKVRFIGGNGEGEILENLDPQQYFGFDLDLQVIPGLYANFGISSDGNLAASKSTDFYLQQLGDSGCLAAKNREDRNPGFSAERMGVGVRLDGTQPWARGLKAGIGWQKSTFSDKNREVNSMPTFDELSGCYSIDPNLFFIEDTVGADDVAQFNRVVTGLSVSWRIMDTVTAAFDFQQRVTKSESFSPFQRCEKVSSEGTCSEPGLGRDQKLSESTWSAGLGMDIERQLNLSLEYHHREFDRLYHRFNYDNGAKKAAEMELFVARIAYNWGT